MSLVGYSNAYGYIFRDNEFAVTLGTKNNCGKYTVGEVRALISLSSGGTSKEKANMRHFVNLLSARVGITGFV